MSQAMANPEQQENLNLDYKKMADAIRILAVDAVKKANSGHTGMPHGHGRYRNCSV